MFKIVTDSTADLPAEYLQEHDLGCINLSYIMDGVTYGQGQELPEKEFYALMRNGKMPTTSQVNPEEAKNHFLKYLKENKEILCIAFSSGLSGTYNSMRVAAEEIMEEQPDCRIIVIDSLCASLGEGLLVHKAVTLRDQGKSLEEVAEWVKNNRLHLVHVFTVDDLYHLYRGGRVSRATAVVGTLAGIKPKLHVDDEGHLIVIGKEKLAPAKGCIIGKDATLLGGLTNTPAPTVNNGVLVSLDENSVWTVSGDSYITSLTLAQGATVKAPEGKQLEVTVDGKAAELTAGTITGKIHIAVV